jgi:integrase
MASICTSKNGSQRISFSVGEGRRKTLYLGKVSNDAAKRMKKRVEAILEAKENHIPLDPRWLADLPEKLAKKMAAVGLIPGKARSGTLGNFLDEYIKQRASRDVTGATARAYRHTHRNLIALFGVERRLDTITAGDADRFRQALSGARPPGGKKKLSQNTVNRRCSFAKQFFGAAVKDGLIPTNPFAGLKGLMVRANRQRDYFLPREDAFALMDATTDREWRLIIALSRFGGLRCPSEHVALRWEDVNWARRRILIHSPKTAHRPGQASRVIPMFPELVEPLRDAFEHAEDGAMFVITRFRDPGTNARNHLLKLIRRAGLTPWPRLFHNMRASRETELAASHPIHVVCEWIGNSRLIAQEHYLRVTQADFDTAVRHEPSDKTTRATTRTGEEIEGKLCQPVSATVQQTPTKRQFPEKSRTRKLVTP